MKESGYLKRQAAIQQAMLEAGMNVMQQYMFDTALITMHEDFGWGYDRLKQLEQKWSETVDAFFTALDATGESDVYQERLDKALQSFIGDRQEFIPFAVRYPDIRQLGYEAKNREKRLKDSSLNRKRM